MQKQFFFYKSGFQNRIKTYKITINVKVFFRNSNIKYYTKLTEEKTMKKTKKKYQTNEIYIYIYEEYVCLCTIPLKRDLSRFLCVCYPPPFFSPSPYLTLV